MTTITIQAIAHSYWRLIKAGRKTFESLSEESKNGNAPMKDQVRHLAKVEVADGVITVVDYEDWTGEEYAALEETATE